MNLRFSIGLSLSALTLSAQPTSVSPYSTDETTIRHGRRLAETMCSDCHGLDRPIAGPALGGITAVRDPAWLFSFVRNPAKMIADGDPHAVALFEQYKFPMTGFNYLSDSELIAIFSFIRAESAEQGLIHNPTDDRGELLELMTVPQEPIVKLGLQLSLEEIATIPVVPNRREIARITTLRYRPDQPDQLYVSDQVGQIYRLNNGEPEQVLDMRKHFPGFLQYPGLASGLGSFAFHPDFATNRLVYVTHTGTYKKQPADYEFPPFIRVPMQWILSEIKLPALDAPFDAGAWRELLRINVPRHVHGMQEIIFSPLAQPGDADYGMLYIGHGDGGATRNGNPELCHNLRSPLGTILRIDPLGSNSRNGHYGIPADNPFLDHADPAVWPEIYAWGFRNPHRLTWDRLNQGRLITADIGERLFEEINVVKPGVDYGWNRREAHLLYDPATAKESAAPLSSAGVDNFEPPLAIYSHMEGQAISGGFVYRGSITALHGQYIFGDIVTGRIFSLDLTSRLPGFQPIRELEIITSLGATTDLHEITGQGRVDLHFGEDATGELYILTKADGKIRRITRARPSP